MHHLSLSGMCDSWIRDAVDLEPYMYVHACYIICTLVGYDRNIYSTLPCTCTNIIIKKGRRQVNEKFFKLQSGDIGMV